MVLYNARVLFNLLIIYFVLFSLLLLLLPLLLLKVLLQLALTNLLEDRIVYHHHHHLVLYYLYRRRELILYHHHHHHLQSIMATPQQLPSMCTCLGIFHLMCLVMYPMPLPHPQVNRIATTHATAHLHTTTT